MIASLLLSTALVFSPAEHPLLANGMVDSPNGGFTKSLIASATLQQQAASNSAPADATTAPPSPPPSLDFDLLGDQGKAVVDPNAVEVQHQMQQRRFLLTAHQAAGFLLAGLMIGTMVTGQLSYSDRFGGPSTGRYETVHSVFAISTEIVFAGTGALALFAPVPIAPQKNSGWSRADVHRFGMLGATVGMFTEAGLGVWTASREGYADQNKLAAVHLAVGYTTLALMIVAVSALVF